jgi:hypothetical protein
MASDFIVEIEVINPQESSRLNLLIEEQFSIHSRTVRKLRSISSKNALK